MEAREIYGDLNVGDRVMLRLNGGCYVTIDKKGLYITEERGIPTNVNFIEGYYLGYNHSDRDFEFTPFLKSFPQISAAGIGVRVKPEFIKSYEVTKRINDLRKEMKQE